MELSAVQYISDKQGHTTGVVVPIEVWQRIQQLLENRPQMQQTNAWDMLENLTGLFQTCQVFFCYCKLVFGQH